MYMKIAIACHPTQGGSGIVATELALGLARRGHQVHLISDERPFRLGDDRTVRFHKVTVTDYPLFKYPPHSLSVANRLAGVVLDHNIDIVHAHYAVPHAVSAMLAKQVVRPYDVKVVTTLHGTDITLVGSHRDFYRICRHAMLECDGLTCVSWWLREQTMREFDLPRPPEVIPNFVDCDRFSMGNRADYPKDGKFTILHASNFRPVKRVFDVVRVFERMSRQLPGARLMMVGDGPELGMACELAAQLHICDRIDFVGAQPQIEDLYRQAHLFLLLSEYESFGLVALEASACAVPVVASRAGGLPEVVDDGVTGYLCPVGDIAQIADRAVHILQDEDRWRSMSQAATLRAHQMFCDNEILPRYERFYEQVLAGKAAVLP